MAGKPKESKVTEEVEVTREVVFVSPGVVKVWGQVGLKVPVPGLDYTMAEFSFGHERYAKNSTQEEIKKAAALVDEFNTTYVDKHLRKFIRDVRRIDNEIENDAPPAPKAKKDGSALARARKRNK